MSSTAAATAPPARAAPPQSQPGAAGLDGMAAVRARFAAMQTTLKTGADQAADDASQRQY